MTKKEAISASAAFLKTIYADSVNAVIKITLDEANALEKNDTSGLIEGLQDVGMFCKQLIDKLSTNET